MSLVFPRDLDAWQSWQVAQHRVRHLKGRIVDNLRPPASDWSIACNHENPQVIVAIDAPNPTAIGSLVAPLRYLDGDLPVAVVAPFPLAAVVEGLGLTVRRLSPGLVDGLVEGARCLVTAGHYLPVGVATERAARRYGRPVLMVQHGALTPYAPPLPPDSTVLAWSDADGEFWRSGRDDVHVETIGSQLLWDARARGAVDHDRSPDPLTYLGQGHAAELPRWRLVQAAVDLCRSEGATYRPHPSERDKLSRLTHAAYRRAGMVVDGSVPLNELSGPVVSVFSTGVLEAAAQGRAAWVDFPDPPAWLREFWERYGMSRFGGEPTPVPAGPGFAPAERIAGLLRELVGG